MDKNRISRNALKGLLVLLTVLILVPAFALSGSSGEGTRIGKPDLTIWSVQVDPSVIGPGVLEYPDTYDADNYIDQQTTMDVSDELPNEGDAVLINLTVFNIGLESGSAEVEFYDGPRETGKFIGRDEVDVRALSYDIANASWDTTGIIGEEHEIFAYLTPDDPENETNPENNEGSREILINFYPHARISGYFVDGGFGVEVMEGDRVLFDGSTSSDTQRDMDAGLLFEWDFGDINSNGSNPDQGVDINLTEIEHIYGDSGSYTIKLTITDQNGASRSDTIVVNVSNRPPEPDFGPSGSIFLEDEMIRFDAGLTKDSDHDLSIMEYRWDLGDGMTTTWSRSSIIEHSYSSSGSYLVHLWAKDDEDIEGHDQRAIEVLNVEPLSRIERAEVNGEEADISGGRLEVNEDDNIQLIGHPEDTPSDLESLTYFWKRDDGDTIEGKYLSLNYVSKGKRRVSFIVTDEDDATSFSYLDIVVNNLRPIADAGGDRTLTTSWVTLNGSGSWDTPTDRSELAYTWDLGDGSIINGMVVHHRYETKGTYDVTLTAEDDDGEISWDRIRITIENLAPEPSITAPHRVLEDKVFTLDASSSRDPDGEIRSYTWSFPVGNEREGAVIEHTFDSSGIYSILLSITDDNDAVSKLFWDITVENIAPEADAGEDNETVLGISIVLDGSRSNDTASDRRNLSYSWRLENGTIMEGRIVEVLFGSEGEHIIELTVMDPEGLVSVDTITIWVLGSVLESIEMEFKIEPKECGPGDEIKVSGQVSFNFRGPIDDREVGSTVVNIHVDGRVYTVHPDRNGRFEFLFSAPTGIAGYEVKCTISRLGLLKEEIVILSVVEEDHNSRVIAFATSPAGVVTGSALIIVGGGFALAMSTDIGRWKFFLLLIPLFSRIKRDDVLDNFERGRIYQYILINPGDYFSHIKGMLDLNSGTLTYHLKVLEQREFIKSRTDGRVKRFYPYGMKVERGPHRDIQSLILELLAFNPHMSQREIARSLGIHVSTVNYHINMMVGAGLLLSERSERVQRYEVQYVAQEIPVD